MKHSSRRDLQNFQTSHPRAAWDREGHDICHVGGAAQHRVENGKGAKTGKTGRKMGRIRSQLHCTAAEQMD